MPLGYFSDGRILAPVCGLKHRLVRLDLCVLAVQCDSHRRLFYYCSAPLSRAFLVGSPGEVSRRASFGPSLRKDAGHKRDEIHYIFDPFLTSPDNMSDIYTIVCCWSLSAERASLDIGMLTITRVPEPFDSIFISPWN